ncbi:MAG: DNA polymerase V, subunit C, partial [Verrucomicrobiota bacterium]|nr:DNA polymerase V, subunit C [Verrucomicrobiota bacterium]
MIALADCNNFYVSCERVFKPWLNEKPVIVLSNNDGCAIARSNEAKRLGIKMGAPYYQIKGLCQKNQVSIFSSNYELYGDMSKR